MVEQVPRLVAGVDDADLIRVSGVGGCIQREQGFWASKEVTGGALQNKPWSQFQNSATCWYVICEDFNYPDNQRSVKNSTSILMILTGVQDQKYIIKIIVRCHLQKFRQ